MRGEKFFQHCHGCRNVDWCKRHGCMAWNDESRHKYDQVKRRSQEIEDDIDRLEKILAADI